MKVISTVTVYRNAAISFEVVASQDNSIQIDNYVFVFDEFTEFEVPEWVTNGNYPDTSPLLSSLSVYDLTQLMVLAIKIFEENGSPPIISYDTVWDLPVSSPLGISSYQGFLGIRKAIINKDKYCIYNPIRLLSIQYAFI